MRALILGHFSTIGDVDSLAYVTEILREEGVAYDVLPFIEKLSAYLDRSINRADLKPSAYTHLIVVCGPFWPELLERRGIDLNRFEHCTRIGVNLTMIEPIGNWNPFHLLLERDSDRQVRPDLTFLQHSPRVPVAGICTIAKQREYGDRQRHAEAVELLRQLLQDRKVAAIDVDTRWPAYRNSGGLGSAAEVISVIERTDLLLTNRLHGMVYALKGGVPVLAIDPVAGGDKIMAQAEVLGWPAASTVDAASPQWIERMFDWCLSAEGREAAKAIAEVGRTKLLPVGEQLREAVRSERPHLPLPPLPTSARGSWTTRLFRRLGRRRS